MLEIGSPVLVLHGHGVPGKQFDEATVVSCRDDGMVLCRFSLGGTLWIPESDLETGDPTRARATMAHAIRQLTTDQWLVLNALVAAGKNGLTDHEHADRNGLEPATVKARREELVRLGLVTRTHDLRSVGRVHSTVHLATARGRAVWQYHRNTRRSAA